MKHIILFEDYQGIYEYIDFILCDTNEKLSSQTIIDKFNLVLNKIKDFSDNRKRKILTYLISSILSMTSINDVIKSVNHVRDPMLIQITNQMQSKYKDPTELSISENGEYNIKKFEKIRLKAYEVSYKHKKKKITDKKITIGYGHAEPVKTSRFRVGDVIDIRTANNLFKEDINKTHKYLQHIFKEWKREGVDIKLTQNQYDAIMSVAFNVGGSALKRSEFMNHVKNGDFETAAEKLLTTRVSKKFPGLSIRRQSEADLFLSSM